jgi:hypothetical protein
MFFVITNQNLTQNPSHYCFRHRYLLSCSSRWFLRTLQKTRSTSPSEFNGRPLDFCLHGQPVSVNCLYHARMVLFVWRVLCVLCTICMLHHNHIFIRVIFQHTKRLLFPERPFSHHIHSHRLVAEMWTTMNNNLMEEKIKLFLLSVQVS